MQHLWKPCVRVTLYISLISNYVIIEIDTHQMRVEGEAADLGNALPHESFMVFYMSRHITRCVIYFNHLIRHAARKQRKSYHAWQVTNGYCEHHGKSKRFKPLTNHAMSSACLCSTMDRRPLPAENEPTESTFLISQNFISPDLLQRQELRTQ